jgi:hypothetical protein
LNPAFLAQVISSTASSVSAQSTTAMPANRSGGDAAEIGHPPVVCPLGGTGVRSVRGWIALGGRQSRRVQLEGQAEIGEQDFGGNALAIELSEPGVRVGTSFETTVIDHVLLPGLDELGVEALP